MSRSWEDEVFGKEKERAGTSGGVGGGVGEEERARRRREAVELERKLSEAQRARQGAWERVVRSKGVEDERVLYRAYWSAKQAVVLLPMFTLWEMGTVWAGRMRGAGAVSSSLWSALQDASLRAASTRWLPFFVVCTTFYSVEIAARMWHFRAHPSVQALLRASREEEEGGSGVGEGVGGVVREGGDVGPLLSQEAEQAWRATMGRFAPDVDGVVTRARVGGRPQDEVRKQAEVRVRQGRKLPPPVTATHAVAGAVSAACAAAMFWKRVGGWKRAAALVAGGALLGPIVPPYESVRHLDMLPTSF
jgi:hypothetical protein